MIKLDCEQGSAEWHKARLGIPTASRFSEIMTKGLKLSASADKYIYKLLGEWALGQPNDSYVSQFMQRGIELEPKAVEYYEMIKGVETTLVGFCTTDDGLVGCSPDRLVGIGGGLEIKVPEIGTHIGYLAEPEHLEKTYKAQVQGALYVTDAGHWDILSYNPELPAVMIRCYRDEEYIAALDSALNQFNERMADLKEKLEAKGITEFKEEDTDPTIDQIFEGGRQ